MDQSGYFVAMISENELADDGLGTVCGVGRSHDECLLDSESYAGPYEDGADMVIFRATSQAFSLAQARSLKALFNIDGDGFLDAVEYGT